VEDLNFRRIAAIIAAVVIGIIIVVAAFSVATHVDASELVVKQSPVAGDLTWYTSPGMKYQGFGKITKYKRRSQFWFSSKNDQGKPEDESIEIRFNDGGHANISGGISWEMPLDDEHLTACHQKFGSQEAIEKQLIKTVIQKSVYMTGPLMSSTESYAGRRNELLQIIEDQIQNGVYLTKTVVEAQKDPITGVERKISVVQLVTGQDGKPLRAEDSALKEFGIHVFNLAINDIKYEDRVEEQIKQQQQATMQVQLAIAEAKRAEQQVMTTQKEGESSAAKAEWEQKTIAAKLVQEAKMKKEVAETEANQKLQVAQLDAKAAEEFKKAETSRGEGEANRRKAVMAADGALEKKLAAWVEAQKAYAEAIGKAGVPHIVFGADGKGGGASSGVQQLIDILSAKTAMDLDLNMKVKKPEPKNDQQP
jgi:hypothetical protein